MPGPVQSIERAAAILRLLAASSGRLGVGEIASSLGLARGTAHGILRTLERVGFVEQDGGTGKYQLGAALLHLGTSYLDVNELRSRAINWADALASRSGEAVRIGTLLDGKVLVVHHVFRPDDTLQAMDVGSLLPLHATALGKALLAHDANAAASIRDTVLESYCRRTITDPKELARAATRVRENGWAAETEELSIGEGRDRRPDPRARGPGRRGHRHLRRGRADLRLPPRPRPEARGLRARRRPRRLPGPRRFALVTPGRPS
ncbi:DNA-binding IclR family transcriptional regulator [Actinomadura luteofluorescens]|uniref:Glycerol operon regulatory protein n=1 Tax=Actinomadura luteofluorescens TaxID=46163 RepID=A0A7Y9EQH9_9ACTN|nr:DNA-binding IclR family transcriptional regulator [Actinomadura luteofluorescens]